MNHTTDEHVLGLTAAERSALGRISADERGERPTAEPLHDCWERAAERSRRRRDILRGAGERTSPMTDPVRLAPPGMTAVYTWFAGTAEACEERCAVRSFGPLHAGGRERGACVAWPDSRRIVDGRVVQRPACWVPLSRLTFDGVSRLTTAGPYTTATGDRYHPDRHPKETAKRVRADIRAAVKAGRLPALRYSVRQGSSWRSLAVTVLADWSWALRSATETERVVTGIEETVTDEAHRVGDVLHGIAERYLRNTTGVQTDYFAGRDAHVYVNPGPAAASCFDLRSAGVAPGSITPGATPGTTIANGERRR
jgi:hypothetical protein